MEGEKLLQQKRRKEESEQNKRDRIFKCWLLPQDRFWIGKKVTLSMRKLDKLMQCSYSGHSTSTITCSEMVNYCKRNRQESYSDIEGSFWLKMQVFLKNYTQPKKSFFFKSKGVFLKEMKSFRKESGLIFHQMWGERCFLSSFSFFSSTPFGAIFNRPKSKILKFRFFF